MECDESPFLNARCAIPVVQKLVMQVWYDGPLC